MPTIQASDIYVNAVNAISDMFERVHTIGKEALTDILESKLAARDALLPAYDEINADHKSAKDDPTKASDITYSEFNTVMVGRAKDHKTTWKHSVVTVRELLGDLALHTDDRLATFYLWCVDGQGTDRDGNAMPPKLTTFPEYVTWLRRVETLEKEQSVTNAFSAKTGKMLPAAKAVEDRKALERETARLTQVTTTDYVTPANGETLRVHIEKLQRQHHDIGRALELIKRACLAETAHKDSRKAWTDASRTVNKAIKGETA